MHFNFFVYDSLELYSEVVPSGTQALHFLTIFLLFHRGESVPKYLVDNFESSE